jgi:mono/diheme cytochrome c family protein
MPALGRTIHYATLLPAVFASLALHTAAVQGEEQTDLFRQVAPILEKHCLSCHGGTAKKGGLSLATLAAARQGGDTGPAVVAGKPADSLLLDMVSGAKPRMPRKAPPLEPAQVELLKKWIAEGAKWPREVTLKDRKFTTEPLWSLHPLQRPAVPALKNASGVRNPIDAFVRARLEAEGLTQRPEADRRTLIRRLNYDLLGLPPTLEEIDAFVKDERPDAYERLVDRLLASPRYGERWARHWLDLVHYGDTHGYDKDKLRPNAWPYRDYVIRALNEDKSYTRFIQEQIAGDVFFPGTRDGIVGMGFLAAGPWDFVGHVELREGTLDKNITRNLDRDDMVATTMNTFVSLTVQCARCHDHKFDPIKQEDYYSLQAVFAAIDRADRPYDADPDTARKREEILRQQAELQARKQKLEERIGTAGGPELAALDRRIAELTKPGDAGPRPEFGYHSGIEARQDVTKWVQIDLGKAIAIETIVYVGCHDTFHDIGAGFGFPVRYKIEISDDPEFKTAERIVDHTAADVKNPGVKPQSASVGGKKARHVRFTATKLAPRANDFILALGELMVLTPQGNNAAAGARVTSLDSIEAAPRWRRTNLVDGYYYGIGATDRLPELLRLRQQRKALMDRVVDAVMMREEVHIEKAQGELAGKLAVLPTKGVVFAGATEFAAAGGFMPTHGKPRPIHVLQRGSEKNPKQEVGPGTVQCLPGLEGRFKLGPEQGESERRAALARWIADPRNPLTWRSIVNRVWQHHFGQGLVETPSDFGRMGGKPSHPELLDWLAVEFRDGCQSLKDLHRLMVTSGAYRQTSATDAAASKIDSGNRLLWRMNRRRLEAEAVRDSVLMVSGKLDLTMGGPGYRPFGFLDDHSPHYKYEEYNPDEPAGLRRSIYRFLVRSSPEPFQETLDCADPSLQVEKRNETLTALQALALLNNKFMVRMTEHFAARAEKEGSDLPGRVTAAHRLALGRSPTEEELRLLTELARKHGLAHTCRLLFNTNEFVFVD